MLPALREKDKFMSNYNKIKKRSYSTAEKKSWKRGFLAGLFSSKKKTKHKSKKEFGFLAFNDNCDVFNVKSYGFDRKDALHNAKKHLKRDPEIPSWGVTITNDKPDSNYYRHVTVYDSGKVSDSWVTHYRDRDNDIRAIYKDLSQPVKR